MEPDTLLYLLVRGMLLELLQALDLVLMLPLLLSLENLHLTCGTKLSALAFIYV